MNPPRVCLPVAALPGFGYVYVLQFSEGTVKVGHTTAPFKRISDHVGTAWCFGIDLERVWLSDPVRHPRGCEGALLVRMERLPGAVKRRDEWFSGVDFDVVTTMAAEWEDPVGDHKLLSGPEPEAWDVEQFLRAYSAPPSKARDLIRGKGWLDVVPGSSPQRITVESIRAWHRGASQGLGGVVTPPDWYRNRNRVAAS